MTHRRRMSAVALLTVVLSLALCAGAWGQSAEEPAGSDNPPAAQREGSGEEAGATASERDVNCSDFETQEEAQRFFEEQGGPEKDPHRLDEDPGEDDGRACENLPSEDAGSGAGSEGDGGRDGETPVGSVDSGYGPVAPAREVRPIAPIGLVAASASLTLLVLSGFVYRRVR